MTTNPGMLSLIETLLVALLSNQSCKLEMSPACKDFYTNVSATEREKQFPTHPLDQQLERRGTVAIEEAVIVLGRRNGIRGRDLAAALGVGPSAVTRRIDAARSREKGNPAVAKLEAALSGCA